MSIIIQFNSSAFGQSAIAVNSSGCHLKRNVKLEMVSGIEHSDVPGMTDDSNSIDVASSSIISTTLKETKITNFGSCFGLPYQDHNYGAPPPPTPPSHSPCPSPVPCVPLPDEDTTLSVISNSTNEDVPEESVTRCICGFEHDDEYMISCDNCLVWQHVDCMGLDRNNMPDTYMCDKCEPRKLDRHKAKLLQSRKKNSLTAVKSPMPVSTKQGPSFNNCLSGKDLKKRPVGQNTEKWSSAHKIEFRENSVAPRFNYSTDSDDGLNKNLERRPKTRSKRRKREEEKTSEMCEQSSKRKSKKHGKERMEAKRTKLRRGKSKESTSTADEEAQDAWEYSLEWCEKNFEDAINNQYTPEIQRLARTLSTQGFEKKYLEQMRTKQCHAYDDGKRKQLVCLRDLPRNSPLIEYKGKFLLASQFHDIHPLYNKRLYPYVLFYVLDQDEICIDASIYGNDARFMRRSCKPNAEIRHMVYNGKLHLYLSSTRVIFREDEVTIPLIVHPNDSLKDFECVCGTDECLVKPKKKNGTIEVCHEKKRRTRRSTVTADEDSNHSVDIKPPKQQTKNNHHCEKPKQVTIKSEPIEPQVIPVETVVTPTPIKEEPEVKCTSDYEFEECSISAKRKQTREERKLQSWIRAFSKMEEAEKRKKNALEKQQSNPKLEIPDEKPELESKKEEKPSTVVSSTISKDEEKVAPLTPKSKKGYNLKRRRGSGTPSRRRTRTNSGGSDFMSLDEASPTKCAPSVDVNSASLIENIVPPPVASPPPVSASGLISPVPTVTPSSPHVLKTKRSLMNEWLQEKSEAVISNPVSSPLPIHTEMKWNMSAAVATCYVRCTKDTPHPSGISAAHLRRSNSAGHMKQPSTGQGSAKKRWLRQAMYDCHGCEIKYDPCGDPSSNMDNGCLSPNSHIDLDGFNGEDVLTPLKKRRLMRESIESLPSPQSPSTATSIEDTDATTVSNSLISDNSNEHVIDTVDNEISYPEKEHSFPTLHEGTDNSIHMLDDVRTENNQTEDSLKDNKESDMCTESFFAPISTSEIISNGYSECITEKSAGDICSSELKNAETDIADESSKQSDLSENSNVDKLNSNNNSQPIQTLPALTKLEEKNAFSDIKLSVSNEIPEEKGISNLIKNETPVNKGTVTQEQPQNLSAAITPSSSVNSAADIQTNNSPTNQISCSSTTTDNSFVTKEQPQSSCSDLKSELSSSSSQDDKVIFPSKNENNCTISEVNTESVNSSETMEFVNNQDGDSTNSSSTDPLNQAACSSVSSCNNVDSSNSFTSIELNDSESSMKVEAMEISEPKPEVTPVEEKKIDLEAIKPTDTRAAEEIKEVFKPDPQARCTSNEDTSPDVKICASATQKRKVSLSEYRMRMRENTSKVQSNSGTATNNSNPTSICAISLPDTLPEQVTLAPLPLFDKIRARKPLLKQPIPQIENKNKEESKETEKDGDVTGYRENLNERLKREFGFDVSEGNTNAGLLRSKITGISNSLLGARPSTPPPPPPPPRPCRPQHESVGINMPTQFSFTPPPFPRPQFIIPQAPGPGTPYLPSQPPPILPTVHPMNTAQCNLRPPLIPSTHPFNPSMTLLRPPQHDYTPVNAQRFAALVQQPPPRPPHKSYLHVYPSGLYK